MIYSFSHPLFKRPIVKTYHPVSKMKAGTSVENTITHYYFV